ncbi:hypothetical protein Asfd1_37 [Aeromonas phage Asfd_1]|nr:hypothetical protein Asfd1_37 [Aeromonas phage Asfd_1]
MRDPLLMHYIFGSILVIAFVFLIYRVYKDIQHDKWVAIHNKKLALQAEAWMKDHHIQKPPKPRKPRPRY